MIGGEAEDDGVKGRDDWGGVGGLAGTSVLVLSCIERPAGTVPLRRTFPFTLWLSITSMYSRGDASIRASKSAYLVFLLGVTMITDYILSKYVEDLSHLWPHLAVLLLERFH